MSLISLENFPSSPLGKNGFPWMPEENLPLPNLPHLPKITLITPSFNQGQFLEETIRSVLLQNYPNLEYIIVDGGSTDNSVEIIRKYEKWISHWTSEPDQGQSHALNKGLALATGDIFNWVNSDDLLAPGALLAVARAFGQQPETEVICGRFTMFSENSRRNRLRMEIFPSLEKTLIFGSVSPCCMYWRLPVLTSLGELDERLDHCMDLELWHRYVEKFGVEHFRFFEENLAFFRLHHASKTISRMGRSHVERCNLQRSILQSVHPSHPWLKAISKLGLPACYERCWDFPTIDANAFALLSMQNMLQSFPLNFNRLDFFRLFFQCLLHSTCRGWSLWQIPLRRWKHQFSKLLHSA